MKTQYLLVALLAVIGAFGCSHRTNPEAKRVSADYSRTEAVTIPKTGLRSREQDLVDEQDFVDEVEDEPVLTLPRAIAMTLERSPELLSFSYHQRVSEARTLQAGLRPNPELSFQVEDAFGPSGRGGYSQATLQLSQLIELGDKRAARVEVARAVGSRSRDEYEIRRIEVLTSLTDKFIRTVTDEHLLQLAREGEAFSRRALQNVEKRLQVGGASELEEAKARVLLARAAIAVEHAEHELLHSKRELASYWGHLEPRFSEIAADLFQTSSLPSFHELTERIEQSPQIRRWLSEKRLGEAEKKLAEAKSIPDLLVGAGPRYFDATNNHTMVFQFSVPLTIFDRNQGAREEAALLSDKVSVDEKASRLRLVTTLFGLLQEAQHAKTVLKAMHDEILPQAKRSLEVAQSGYEQGRMSYLELFDAQKTLLEVSREHIEAAYTFHSFINAIERLLGAPIVSDENIFKKG